MRLLLCPFIQTRKCINLKFKREFVSCIAWKVSKYGVFPGLYFPVFGLNLEIYSVNLRIQSKCMKILTSKNSVFEHFSRSDNNEKWCKIRRGIDFSLQNWQEEFDKFWLELSHISKSCTLRGCFWPEYIMFELNKYRGVMLDGTEYRCKFEGKQTYAFKNDMNNLVNFHQSTFKSLKIGNIYLVLFSKVGNIWA